MRKSILCKIALIACLLFPAIGVLQGSALYAKIVKGTVTSATDGEPLTGATVKVIGAQSGTVTDLDGHFSLEANDGQTLLVSYIGFVQQKVKVTGNNLTIQLAEEANSLNDVVVIGYGVQKKKLVTGATLQVKGDDVAKLNTTNPLQALQGQTPGMTIVSESGQPGEGLKVNIRGIGTTGSSSPLYIIDGVRGDIATLNPADIESIDVLKDAASAAIYGSQSANGVVLVTTKSGKDGRTTVSFDGYRGWQNAIHKVDMLNAQQYMAIMDEQNINSGGQAYDWSKYYTQKDADGNVTTWGITDPATGKIYDTDWVDQMFKSNAGTESYTLGITGGNSKGHYATSLGYMNQEGIVGGKDVSYYSRYNFRVNSEYNVIDKFLKVGEQVSFIYYKKRGLNVGNQYNNSLRSAFGTSPLAPVYSDNGVYGSPYNDTTNSPWFNADGNPYGVMMVSNSNQSKNATFTGNVYAEFQFIKNLKFRTTLGVKYDSNDYRGFNPLYHFSVYSYNDTRTTASQSKSDGTAITWTNTLTYNWNLGQHNFYAMLGTEAYRTEGSSLYAANGSLREGFDTWKYAWVSNGTAKSSEEGLSASGSPWDEERMLSYFGRLSWNYKETYMATATLRCDGSSRFARGHRFGWFPSVSAGWVMSNEKWWKPISKYVDYFKLRGSWGQVGNQNIGNYMYTAPVSFSNIYYNFGTTKGSAADQWGARVTRLANEDITWETSEQTDFGFDARVLGKLNVNFDWYYKTTKD